MEGNKLGSMIGVVRKTCKVTNSAGDAVTINVNIDFSHASDVDIRAWIASDRIIAGQRPWRALSKDDIVKLDGMTFDANTIGAKVKSLKESTTALLNQFNGKSKDEIVEILMQTPNMVREKAELLAEAMIME